MRWTWRTVLWEGWPVIALPILLAQWVLLAVGWETGVIWPSNLFSLLSLPVCVAGLYVSCKYPRRGDLPEWQEYARGRGAEWGLRECRRKCLERGRGDDPC